MKEYWGINQGTRKELGQNGLTEISKTLENKFRYWGVKDGRPSLLGQNGTVSDIANTIGSVLT